MFNSDGSYNKAECKKCVSFGSRCAEMNTEAERTLCNAGCEFTPEAVETVMGVNGVDYRGKQEYTVSGKKCQSWKLDVPNNRGGITPEAHPNAGLLDGDTTGKSYCRNPDKKTTGIWCFTTDASVAWESCNSINGENKDKVRTCIGDKEGCGLDPKCAGYAGDQNKTRSGKTCQAWNVNTPHKIPPLL
jgi:hypothetical protein